MSQPRQIKRELEDAGYNLADLGRELKVSRQLVSKVILGGASSNRIRERITEIIGYCPWADAAPPDDAA